MSNFDLRKYLVENKLTADSRLAEGRLHEENSNQLDIFSPYMVNVDKDFEEKSSHRDYYNRVWLEFRQDWARKNRIKYKSSDVLNRKVIDHFEIPYPDNRNFPDSAQWLEDQGILKIQAEGKLSKEQVNVENKMLQNLNRLKEGNMKTPMQELIEQLKAERDEHGYERGQHYDTAIELAEAMLEKEKEVMCGFTTNFVEYECFASVEGEVKCDLSTEEYFDKIF